MSELRDKDAIEYFDESMKKAAACARQLAAITKIKSWVSIATNLEGLRSKGMVMYSRPAPGRQETLRVADKMVDEAAKKATLQ